MVEGSKNISPKQFDEFKKFIKSAVDKFRISESANRVAVIEYSDDPTIAITLADYTNSDRLKEAVDRIQPSRGEDVATDKALRFVASDVYTSERGSRVGVPKVVLVLTGSKSTGSVTLKNAAQSLVDRGAKVYVVHVGKSENPELKNVTTEGENGVVTVPDGNPLATLGGNIARKIASDVEKGSRGA